MTEKRFRVQEHCLRSSYGIEAENWLVTNDNHSVVLNDKAEAHMVANLGNDVINKLNNLYEENQELLIEKTNIQKLHSYELSKKLEYKSELIDLKKENEQLKKALVELKEIGDYQYGRIKELSDENEQLKQQNADWETSFDICKHYKEAYGTEIVKIKQTIKDMMENERTELGRSVLKQLWSAIQ